MNYERIPIQITHSFEHVGQQLCRFFSVGMKAFVWLSKWCVEVTLWVIGVEFNESATCVIEGSGALDHTQLWRTREIINKIRKILLLGLNTTICCSRIRQYHESTIARIVARSVEIMGKSFKIYTKFTGVRLVIAPTNWSNIEAKLGIKSSTDHRWLEKPIICTQSTFVKTSPSTCSCGQCLIHFGWCRSVFDGWVMGFLPDT